MNARLKIANKFFKREKKVKSLFSLFPAFAI